MNNRPLYRELASLIQALRRCKESKNTEWEDKHSARIDELLHMLPSGNGIDHGTQLDIDYCSETKLVFLVDYHHMHEHGYYDGWTSHKLTVTPSFDGIDLVFSGRDRNGIKEYLYETYHYALTQMVDIGGAA